MPQSTSRRRIQPVLLSIYIFGASVTISLLLSFFLESPKPVHATPNEMGYTEDQYPIIVGTRLDSCTLCHTEVGSFLFNPYGQAFNDQLGTAAEDFKAIENFDSDGDGYTNIQEIRSGTNPGDPKDHPVGAPSLKRYFLPLVDFGH